MLDPMPTIPVSTETPCQLPNLSHDHSWLTESRHRVSDGLILYVRCSGCGSRRVDLQTAAQLVPAGISTVV